MTTTEWEPQNLLDVLGDSLCRRILVIADQSPVAATTLSTRLDVSPPTVYRRIDVLSDNDLLRERRRRDGDGNHYRTFVAALDSVEVSLTESGYEVSVARRNNLGNRFDEFWREFSSAELPAGSGRSTETEFGDDSTPS